MKRRVVSAPVARFVVTDNLNRPSCKDAWNNNLMLRLSSGISLTQQSNTLSRVTSQASNVKPRQPEFNGKPRLPETLYSRHSVRAQSARTTIMDNFPQISLSRASMNVWRIKASTWEQVSTQHIGFFHEAACYIVLRVFEDKTTSLHYWLGSFTNQRQRENAHEKAHRIDVTIERAHVFSREVQGHESKNFMKLFPDGVVYTEGAPKSSIAQTYLYVKRLYVVEGRKFARAKCREPATDVLDASKCVILDGFPRIYVWTGAKSSYISRMKTIQIARRMRSSQRKGKAHIVVIDDEDTDMCKCFMKKLQNSAGNKSEESDEKSGEQSVVLHRLYGDHVLCDMPLVATKPLQQKFLTKADIYLLGSGFSRPLYIWVGSKCPAEEISHCISRARAFADHLGNPNHQSICRLLEGNEPAEFKETFNDWRDKLMKQRGLFVSRNEQRTMTDIPEVEDENDNNGSTEVWKVKNGSLEPVSWDEHGIFSNGECYVILHTNRNSDHVTYTLFYWLGSKSETEEKEAAQNLCLDMDCALDYQTLVVRVLDGKEPQIFFNIIHNTMIVYDKDAVASSSSLQLYSVSEFNKGCMRVLQVTPVSSSLHSQAAFVLLTSSDCILWYGKKSGGLEREYAKHMLGYLCPDKMYSYTIITQGKEPANFWEALGGKIENKADDKDKPSSKLEKRSPRLLQYTVNRSGSPFYEEIDEFLQEDICDEDIVVMDTFDEIFIWCGKSVENNRRKNVAEIAKYYIAIDLAGRLDEDVLINFTSQGAEPDSFTRHFKAWSADGYGGRTAYSIMRKRIRQENAKIDIDVDLVDKTYRTQLRYCYKTLMRREPPAEVNLAQKQHHLSNKEFEEAIGLTREQFYQYPEWKQEQILRSARLAFLTTAPTPTSLSHSVVPPLSLESF